MNIFETAGDKRESFRRSNAVSSEINAFLQTQKLGDSALTTDMVNKLGMPAGAVTAKYHSSEYGSTFRSKKKTYVVRKRKDASRSSSKSRSPSTTKVTGTMHELLKQGSPAKSAGK